MTKRLTKDQAAIIGTYTGYTLGPFSDIHEYVEKFLGRVVFTHEFADDKFCNEIRIATREDFISVCYVT